MRLKGLVLEPEGEGMFELAMFHALCECARQDTAVSVKWGGGGGGGH